MDLNAKILSWIFWANILISQGYYYDIHTGYFVSPAGHNTVIYAGISAPKRGSK